MTISAISISNPIVSTTTDCREQAIKLFGKDAESLQKRAGGWEKLIADWDIFRRTCLTLKECNHCFSEVLDRVHFDMQSKDGVILQISRYAGVVPFNQVRVITPFGCIEIPCQDVVARDEFISTLEGQLYKKILHNSDPDALYTQYSFTPLSKQTASLSNSSSCVGGKRWPEEAGPNCYSRTQVIIVCNTARDCYNIELTELPVPPPIDPEEEADKLFGKGSVEFMKNNAGSIEQFLNKIDDYRRIIQS